MKVEHKCNLIVDSCCDLPYSMIDQPGIELLKFPYTIGDECMLDDMFTSRSPHDFYQGMRKGETPTTAQIPPKVLIDTFTRAAKSGVPTVFLSFSSGLSGHFDTASLAMEQVKADYPEAELYIADTRLACIAEGLLVAEAIYQREAGLSAKELKSWAEEALYFVNSMFMVDDLSSLSRGGRLPSMGAFLGSKLDVKPLCNFDIQGHLSMIGVARGRKKAIRALCQAFEREAVKDPAPGRVIVAHADCEKDCSRLKDLLLKQQPNLMIIESNVGPVIGSHVGPGMLAITFWGKDRREMISLSDKFARNVRDKSK